MIYRWKEYPTAVKVILSIYTLGFLIGTYTHSEDILLNGLLSHNASLFLNIYWDSLTLLDPIAALLVWVKPKPGIGLAVFIMFTDIIINVYAYTTGIFGEFVPGMIPMFLFLQSLFATYVFVTAPVVLEKLRERSLV